jgi:hypothetical protein
MHRYVDRIFQLATTSPAAKRALQEVMHMVAEPAALFRAAMVLAVLRDALPRAGRPLAATAAHPLSDR